jgi:hypothetical protein
MIRLATVLSLGCALTLPLMTGCRPAPDDQAGATPRGSPVRAVPPEYRFLQHPGVGMKDIDSIWAALPYDSIYLRRDPCFGACPMFEAALYRGGRARYHGTRFVERLGDFQGEVTVQDYGRLSYLLDRLEFMSLPDSFSVPYTDLPGATLAVSRRSGGVKFVHDYGYVGPVELWTLMEIFDGIVGRIQWQKSGP